MEIKLRKAFSTKNLETENVPKDACAQVVDEDSKTIVMRRKITLVDKELCKKKGSMKSCSAMRKIIGGTAIEGYKCDFFGVNLFWRGSTRDGSVNEIKRCDECLRQERENGNEQI